MLRKLHSNNRRRVGNGATEKVAKKYRVNAAHASGRTLWLLRSHVSKIGSLTRESRYCRFACYGAGQAELPEDTRDKQYLLGTSQSQVVLCSPSKEEKEQWAEDDPAVVAEHGSGNEQRDRSFQISI